MDMRRINGCPRGDNDEERHHVQHHDAGGGIDPLVLEVVGVQTFVRDVRLLKERHPWRDRGADDGD